VILGGKAWAYFYLNQKFMKTHILVFALFTWVKLGAQPVFDYNQIPAPGSEIEYYYRLDGGFQQVNTGPNQTWDFSEIEFDAIEYVRYLAPSSAPGFEAFPQSDLVIESSNELYPDTNYTFCNYSDESFYIDGYSSSNEFLSPVVYGQPYNKYRFPLSYPDNYQGATFVFFKSYAGIFGVDSILTKSYLGSTYAIDGWGDLTIESTTYEVLRLSIFETRIDSSFYRFEGETSFEYQATYSSTKSSTEFIAPDLGIVVCSIEEAEADKGQIVNAYRYYKGGTILNNAKREAKSPLRVYPNPASNNIHIQLDKSSNSHCTARLVDVSGKLVSSFSFISEHQLDVLGLSNGIYFIQLLSENGDFLGVQKILVNH
jgi:hypothetical protein